MTQNSKKMKLIAHKVAYTDRTAITFEDILEQLQKRLPHHSDRTFEALNSTDASVAISKFLTHPSNTGIGAVFSSFTKDAKITTLEFASSDEELKFDEQSADEGSEFLDKNVLLYAVEDTVISCGLGKQQTQICSAIYHLAVDAGIIPSSTSFNFSSIPNADVIENINRVGVKKVDFDATAFIGSLPKSKLNNVLDNIFGSTGTPEALKSRRENVANISIQNSSFWRKTTIGHTDIDRNDWLGSIAKEVVHDDALGEYTIILNDNVPIKSGTLLWCQIVYIPNNGTTFDDKDAHIKMVKFYQDVQRKNLDAS